MTCKKEIHHFFTSPKKQHNFFSNFEKPEYCDYFEVCFLKIKIKHPFLKTSFFEKLENGHTLIKLSKIPKFFPKDDDDDEMKNKKKRQNTFSLIQQNTQTSKIIFENDVFTKQKYKNKYFKTIFFHLKNHYYVNFNNCQTFNNGFIETITKHVDVVMNNDHQNEDDENEDEDGDEDDIPCECQKCIKLILQEKNAQTT